MPDSAGDVVMVYERMGSAVMPETRYVVRSASDQNFPDAGQLLKAGEASYRPTLCGTSTIPVCRWGDFEATSFDGNGQIWLRGSTQIPTPTRPWRRGSGATGGRGSGRSTPRRSRAERARSRFLAGLS
jgi:hypothetical protein